MEQARPVLLVVDDHSPTLDLLSDFLNSEGYRVESAESGAGGLARLKAGGVDAVLVDLRLPDIDGRTLCQRVRSDPRLPKLPIILMSAEAGPVQRDAALAAGADKYLAKPFDLDELLTAVRGARPK